MACDGAPAWNTTDDFPAESISNGAHAGDTDTSAEMDLASNTRKRRKPAPAPSATSRYRAKTPYGQDPAAYVLTLSEEFDHYDHHLWNDHIWYESANSTRNYLVEDGLLKIWPERDRGGDFFNRTIDTDGKYAQTYGYFEIEAKLPKGKGTWPAFWLFAHPGKRRPEIDIMEAYAGGITPWGFMDGDGVPHPRAYGTHVWLDTGKSAGFRQHDTGTDLSAGFHKYGLKWEPDRQTFYFDGKPVQTVDVSMSDPMYIMLDLWFGSDSGTPDDSTPQGKSNAFQIRYVRAWRFR